MAKTVEYFDLKLPIELRQKPAVEEAIAAFVEEFDYVVKEPKMKEKDGRCELRVNSLDLVHLLGYLDCADWLAIDTKRFFKEIGSQLDQLLLKSLNPDYQYHYKWCLSAIKNLDYGRYLDASS